MKINIIWLNLFCGFRGKIIKFTEIRASSLSRLRASMLDFALLANRFITVSPHGQFAPTEFVPMNSYYTFYMYFEFVSHRQWIKEQEINMFCFIVCTILSFFLGMRKINLKHLIARWVNVGANSVGVNSPWGKTGRQRLHHAHLCSKMSLILGSTRRCPDLQQIIN